MNSKHFFTKMAFSNIKNNRKTYLPFILTSIFTGAMFYIVASLAGNEDLENSMGGTTLKSMLALGVWVTAIFAFIFLFYTYSFLFKRRKKEIGIYNILGLDKKHISKIIFYEIFAVFIISVAAGLFIGILLDKLMFLFVAKLLTAEISMGFYISWSGILKTVALLAVIFALIYVNSVKQVHFNNPIELLKGGNVGEKEPKTKWIMAILGVGFVAAGYYISITTKDIAASLNNFLLAVIFVILGTYMLFIAGSIAFLKMLRKNKSYYYKPSHFISISGMIYRMKQNAVGLANICIMSTMVLVMLASTCTLWAGVEKTIEAYYPSDIDIRTSVSEELSDEVFNTFERELEKEGITAANTIKYRYAAFEAEEKGNNFFTVEDKKASDSAIIDMTFITCDDYNKITGSNEKLADNEVILITHKERHYDYKSFNFNGKEFNVNKNTTEFPPIISSGMYEEKLAVVSNQQVLDDIVKAKMQQDIKQNTSQVKSVWGEEGWGFVCDADITTEQGERIVKDMNAKFSNDQYNVVQYNIKSVAENMIRGMYAGLMFIGIFLSTLFIMAMVLIIYYKQISEGYEDKERYRIMQNVGLDKKEIKKTIKSQVMTVFFMPLIVAGIHVAAAFPLISRMLKGIMGMSHTQLYVIITLVAFGIFALFYAIVYTVTSRIYYKIVNG